MGSEKIRLFHDDEGGLGFRFEQDVEVNHDIPPELKDRVKVKDENDEDLTDLEAALLRIGENDE
jgi:hypothetical protein